MKIVYIAGPYRAKTGWEIENNIVAARIVGAAVAKCGAMPLIPHSNTAHFDGLCPDEFWLEGTMELLRRSDAVFLMASWALSSGARAEKAEAERIGLPVFEELIALEKWLHLASLEPADG